MEFTVDMWDNIPQKKKMHDRKKIGQPILKEEFETALKEL